MRREKLRFTNEQIALAESVNIISYAESIGYTVKQVTPKSFKIEGYGGLYIHGNGHKWNWFSQNKGGGAIQFVIEMEGKTWVEAMKRLLNMNNEIVSYTPPKIEKKEEKGEFILPEKKSTFKHIFAYLINTRGIDKEIVYDFVKKDKVYENKYRSCVFIGYDKGAQVKYASVRSTNTTGKSFRCDVKNSDKTYPFCSLGTNDTVCVFEAPIDLMSYLTLIKKYNIKDFESHCISLGGVADKALEYYLKENPNITKIMLCLDNDEAGHFACQQIREKYRDTYKILRHLPEGKDFNEQLLNMGKAYVENTAPYIVAEDELLMSQ
jgi:hypothetical protein